MAELGFQVSTKTNDGTIFVIADATYQGFSQKLAEARSKWCRVTTTSHG